MTFDCNSTFGYFGFVCTFKSVWFFLDFSDLEFALQVFPDLEIKGVDYMQTDLLEGTESEHLLKELDEMLLLPIQNKNPSHQVDQGESARNVEKIESIVKNTDDSSSKLQRKQRVDVAK